MQVLLIEFHNFIYHPVQKKFIMAPRSQLIPGNFSNIFQAIQWKEGQVIGRLIEKKQIGFLSIIFASNTRIRQPPLNSR